MSKELSKRILRSGKFLKLEEVTWLDDDNEIQTWECVSRVNSPQIVNIITWLTGMTGFLFIKQFRPAVGAYVLEFPAGLVDNGETVEDAVHRELREETGYAGKVLGDSIFTFTSPGMSSENIHQVEVEIDENSLGFTDFDEHENITTHKVFLEDLEDFLTDQQKSGVQMSAQMMCYLIGVYSGRALNVMKDIIK